MEISKKIKVKRNPKRGAYDKETIYSILDKEYVCTVAFNYEGAPVLIPTIYGRLGNKIYFHGATTSRMIQSLEKGIEISVCVFKVNALVLAKSVFHHSLNYESVVLFGRAKKVEDEEKTAAFKAVTEQILKDRWEEARQPNAKEYKATSILSLEIEEASAKVRTGNAKDENSDVGLPIWSGIVPIHNTFGKPVPSTDNLDHLEIPDSVQNLFPK